MSYQTLFSQKDKEKYLKNKTSLELPLSYARLRHVYQKLQSLQAFLLDHKAVKAASAIAVSDVSGAGALSSVVGDTEGCPLTYLTVLKRLEKYLGDRYQPVLDEGCQSASLEERCFLTDNRSSSLASNLEFLKALGPKRATALGTISRVRAALQGVMMTAELSQAEEVLGALPALEQEQLFVLQNVKDPFTGRYSLRSKQQQKWLSQIKPFVQDWSQLFLRGYSSLSRSWFNDARFYR